MSRIDTLRRVWEIESQEVEALCGQAQEAQAERVLDALLLAKANGSRVFAAGVGTSAAAAKKVAHSFCCVELPCAFLSPGDAVHGGLGLVQSGDVVILISKGGSTREIVNLLGGLKQKQAVVIGVTENPDSILAKESTIPVYIGIDREPDPFNMLATASTMKVIAYFDAIAIAFIGESGYTLEQFAVIHPGGAVGDRLLGKK